MEDTLILCADIGTTSLKMGIISRNGEVLCSTQKFFKTKDNSLIANEWLEAFKHGFAEIKDKAGLISAVCISGNGPTVVSESGLTLLWNCPVPERIEKKSRGNKIPVHTPVPCL